MPCQERDALLAVLLHSRHAESRDSAAHPVLTENEFQPFQRVDPFLKSDSDDPFLVLARLDILQRVIDRLRFRDRPEIGPCAFQLSIRKEKAPCLPGSFNDSLLVIFTRK